MKHRQPHWTRSLAQNKKNYKDHCQLEMIIWILCVFLSTLPVIIETDQWLIMYHMCDLEKISLLPSS